jgi:NAD(P)-dependent dehydrogenase (short-subunit alcohol dehydrogenase family)
LYGRAGRLTAQHGGFRPGQGLLDTLKASAPARVVVLSSKAQYMTYEGGVKSIWTEHFRDAINNPEEYNPWLHYGQSKLCNALMSAELARRLQGTKVLVNACHPGWVDSALFRHIPGQLYLPGILVSLGNAMLALPTAAGALTPLYLATAPELEAEGISGQYFEPIAVAKSPSANAEDAALAKRLWTLSERIIKEVVEPQVRQPRLRGSGSVLGLRGR